MYAIYKYDEIIGYINDEDEAKEYAKLTRTEIVKIKEIKKNDWPEQITFICASFGYQNYHNNTPVFSFNEITVLDTEINMYKDELFYSKYHVTKNYFNITKDEAEKEFRKTIEDEGFVIVKDINKSNCVTKKIELENLVKKDVDGEECWAKLEEWAEKEKPKTAGLWTSGGYVLNSTPYTINRQPFELLGTRNSNIYVDTEARTEVLSWPTAQPIGTAQSAPTNDGYVTVQLDPRITNTNT